MFQKRVNQVIEKMKTDGLKQILVSEPCSIYYLTGVDVGPGERMFALYLNDEGRKFKYSANNLSPGPTSTPVK